MNLSDLLKSVEPESFWIYSLSHTRNISNQYDLYSAAKAKDVTPQNPGWEMTVDRASYDRMKAIAVRLAESLEGYAIADSEPDAPINQAAMIALSDCAKMLEVNDVVK